AADAHAAPGFVAHPAFRFKLAERVADGVLADALRLGDGEFDQALAAEIRAGTDRAAQRIRDKLGERGARCAQGVQSALRAKPMSSGRGSSSSPETGSV